MPVTFFEEITFDDSNLTLINLIGASHSLNLNNNSFIYGQKEKTLSPTTEQKIIINKSAKIDSIYLGAYNLKEISIKYLNLETPYILNNNSKLIMYDIDKNLNLEIKLKKIKENEESKQLGTLIFLKKIGQLESLPIDVFYKIENIGNTFRKSKGGLVKIIYGKKSKYKLKFIGIGNKDINLLEKLYFYKSSFYMSIFPEREDIEEYGLRTEDFMPLVITGGFMPKLRNNILGIGQDININIEET